jgi:hypothetical protein
MSLRRNGAGNALDRAKVVLAETQNKIAALALERNTALLRGTDADVAKVDAEVDATEKLLRTHGDRIKLLEAEAEKEEAARRAKEHEALIGRVEAKLAERNKISEELASHVAAADAALLRLFAVNRQILAAWPWQNGSLGAVLLGDGAVVGALSNEIFRVAGRPPTTGGAAGDPRGPSYPGGKCENLSWIAMPERSSRPLVARFAEASAAASVILRTGRNGPAPETNGAAHPPGDDSPGDAGRSSIAPPPRVAPQKGVPNPELTQLLNRQLQLADLPVMDAAAEAEYAAIGKQIAALS